MSVVKIPPIGDAVICSENEIPKNSCALGVFILNRGRLRDDVYIRCCADVLDVHNDYSLENRKRVTLYIYGQDRDRDGLELSEEDCKEIIEKCL